MKATVLLLALASVLTFAADNAAIASPTATNSGKEVISIPASLSYQGKLTDTLGAPVPDSDYSVTYRLFATEYGGSPFWSEDRTLRLRGGLFSTRLGIITAIDSIPKSSDGLCYLEMQVGSDAPMTPRIAFNSVPYSYFAREAETANVVRTTVEGPWVRGTPDSVIFTAHRLGIARGGASNGLLGNYPETHLNLGVACTTGVTSGNQLYCTVLGYRNVASGSGSAAVVGGQYNRASGYASSVTGGYYNLASGRAGVVGGGSEDTVVADYGAALGGLQNRAGDAATDTGAVVAGGRSNRVTAKLGFIGGGSGNTVDGGWGAIGGGSSNRASQFYGTVGGGYSNYANDYYATVAGGYCDTASGNSSAVAGGAQNAVTGNYSAVAGGSNNRVTGSYSFAFGRKISSSQSHTAAFFAETDTGYFLINRSNYSDGGRTIEVGNVRGNGNAAYLWDTGIWTDVGKSSDWRESEKLDGDDVIGRIAALDIARRTYKDVRGICVAPDGDEFSKVFGVDPGGAPGDGAISPLDVASVALIAVKELNRKLEAQQVEIEALKAELKRR
jgi:hypothetical protein